MGDRQRAGKERQPTDSQTGVNFGSRFWSVTGMGTVTGTVKCMRARSSHKRENKDQERIIQNLFQVFCPF
jgi:hypothetical protein